MSFDLGQALYDSVAKGDINRVEFLLGLPKTNIDMTWFSENLLMCAIRHKKEKMAKYLINKGIDTNFQASYIEFDEETQSTNMFKYSCREMAYDYGLLNIVDLIDIFDYKTDSKIVKILAKRYLNKTKLNSKGESGLKSHSLHQRRMQIGNEEKHHYEHLNISDNKTPKIDEEDQEEKDKSNDARKQEFNEYKLYKEIELSKPKSSFGNDKKNQDLTNEKFRNSSNSQSSFFSVKQEEKQKSLKQKVTEIVNELDEPDEAEKSLSENNNKITLKYNGFRINLVLDPERTKKQRTSSTTPIKSSLKELNSKINNRLQSNKKYYSKSINFNSAFKK